MQQWHIGITAKTFHPFRRPFIVWSCSRFSCSRWFKFDWKFMNASWTEPMVEFTDALFDLCLISMRVYLILHVVDPVSFDQSECCVCEQMHQIWNLKARRQALVSCNVAHRFALLTNSAARFAHRNWWLLACCPRREPACRLLDLISNFGWDFSGIYTVLKPGIQEQPGTPEHWFACG